MRTATSSRRLIESDAFPFEFLSGLGERESWRKEVHRPIYHIHKWWAKRLGSVFRGILLGCVLPPEADLSRQFYESHSLSHLTVFDPFMGSGTTVGEAHKLGCAALGRDINPVAAESVRVALGPIDRQAVENAFAALASDVGKSIQEIYTSKDSRGRPADVLYYFWVMQAGCPSCRRSIDLFPSWVVARHAFPDRKPGTQLLCPACHDIFPGLYGCKSARCRSCGHGFCPDEGTAKGTKATCPHCGIPFAILDAVASAGERPDFRLYGKLVLTEKVEKEYLPADAEDLASYEACAERLRTEVSEGRIRLPSLHLENGYNTRQAMGYGFKTWRDFFNDRQLLALGLLHAAIGEIPHHLTRDALLTLFSGVLEFNNVFASYKGEGTGAVRHMFSHHILKPERTPIEANVWGTPKSSGSFSNLYRSRLLRAIQYRKAPTEVNGVASEKGKVCSLPFSGEVRTDWPPTPDSLARVIYLSCGDSAETGLPDHSIDLVVTDPPFFDNVHYSELADFFYAWQQLVPRGFVNGTATTRRHCEVQDSDATRFATKLQAVFREGWRVLKDEGLLVFTYHHSRREGWKSVADAILLAGFVVINAHPVKSEMSVATPKSQAKEPIQLDIIVVCRKATDKRVAKSVPLGQAVASAKAKVQRLREAGFTLSRNDHKVVLFGQLLQTVRQPCDVESVARRVESELESGAEQLTLF
jgi:putative DNA methylase